MNVQLRVRPASQPAAVVADRGTRYDPLGLFPQRPPAVEEGRVIADQVVTGGAFTDDYILGFYWGMGHVANAFVLVPVGGILQVRLKAHPDYPIEQVGWR